MLDKALEDLDIYSKVVSDEIPNNMCDDGENFEDFTIEVSAQWVLEMKDHIKKRIEWARDDAAKIEKLQPFANAVLAATKTYTS